MNAFDQVIATLEAEKQHVQFLIDGLRRRAARLGVEVIQASAPLIAAPVDLPPVTAEPPADAGRAVRTSKAARPTRASRTVTVAAGGAKQAVVEALRASAGPLSPREVRERTNLTSSQAGFALQDLRKAGALTATGTTTTRRYALNPGFDVEWNGTKDHDRTAPSLIGTER